MAFPMHGQHKLSREGYRTRDGHLIEWFGRLLDGSGSTAVISRPEPHLTGASAKSRNLRLAENTTALSTFTWMLPRLSDRQAWWVDSLPKYPRLDTDMALADAVVWNPFVSLSASWPDLGAGDRKLVFDLLDDWTVHFAFEGISSQVHRAYETMFARADHVTANSEATAELAQRFGRSDVHLVLNGCDPERFVQQSGAEGAITVGYVGKIGRRLDLDLICQTAERFPDLEFVFAGPILDREYRAPLAAAENIRLLGDVHYERVPDLLTTFDIGWVPHRVGRGEVGGDVIKTYEYRAAGLPVLTTPVLGTGSRKLDDGVFVVDADGHQAWLAEHVKDGRPERIAAAIPDSVTWRHKARFMLDLLGR
ncbi:glycosyltransferase [Gordonia sp. IITR100]|uniref:glycosyltransferase n=1 Tax=Gordonia sp. IITR100 TaxID=1314686 RepID=UPI000990E9CF|nr:glycosyltransferase [Gordonia sp. IITR100]